MSLLFMSRLCLFFSLFFCTSQAFSNESPIEFCKYLFANRNYQELNVYCNTLISSNDSLISESQKDTLCLFLVKARLKLDVNDSTIQGLQTTSYLKEFACLKIYQMLYTDNIVELELFLLKNKELNADTATQYLVSLFKMLKNKQFAECERAIQSEDKSIFLGFKEKIILSKILEITEFAKLKKKKSAVKSALISCIIPGYGKKYSGLPGEAVATMLTNGILGVIFAETIWRKGFRSPYTIGAGLLFSTFYFSNIVGSYYATKRYNLQQQRLINEKSNTVLDFWSNSYFE